MFALENTELSVSLLDPAADRVHLGSRYCAGGYIWQVTDAQHGTLFTGPRWPDPYPDVFDGQGAPDMFLAALGADNVPVGGEVGVIGVGRVRRTSPIEPFSVRHNPEVIEFIPWQVSRTADSVTMETQQTFGAWAYRLTRHVALSGRTLSSRTEIESQGEAPLPVRWFAHPFFPLTADGVLCRFSMPIVVPENPGFYLNDEGFVCRKEGYDWPQGCFQALDFTPEGESLTIVERHPAVGEVTTRTDFAPSFMPIWGNENTFSFEPYFVRELAAGDRATWHMFYTF